MLNEWKQYYYSGKLQRRFWPIGHYGKKGWEGIVSKKINSKYYPGKNHNEWFKHKISRKILAAVCGVNWKNDSPYSLLLGILKENQWIYIGRVSSGLSQKDWQIIKEYAVKYKKEECPFNKTVAWEKQQVTWLTPSLTCWVAFLEWTNDGVLRNPRIIGFSNKSVEEANGKECPIDE